MESNLKKVETAHYLREQFLDFHGKSRLYEIKLLYKLWKLSAHEKLGFETFGLFVSAPVDSGGLDISVSWASELIQTYKRYIVELKLPESTLSEISPRKLYYLKGEVNEKNIDDVLSRAKTLTLQDLQKEKKGIDESNCAHGDWKYFKRCGRCGVWTKLKTKPRK